MSASGTSTPLTLSDLPCESCGLYFRLDSDLIDHRGTDHAVDKVTP